MKTKALYHGSTTLGLTVLEPRKRFTPGSMGSEAPEAIYAGKTKAYAAAHAFPWSSQEGFDVVIEKGAVVLVVPQAQQERLQQKICLYAVPAGSFAPLNSDPKGYNFWTHDAVDTLGCDEYESVTQAIEKNGGKIRVITA